MDRRIRKEVLETHYIETKVKLSIISELEVALLTLGMRWKFAELSKRARTLLAMSDSVRKRDGICT